MPHAVDVIINLTELVMLKRDRTAHSVRNVSTYAANDKAIDVNNNMPSTSNPDNCLTAQFLILPSVSGFYPYTWWAQLARSEK